MQWKILDNFHVANDLGSKNATPACVASFSPKDLDGKPKLKTKTTLTSKKQTNPMTERRGDLWKPFAMQHSSVM